MIRVSGQLKPLEWIGGSRKDLKALPDEVIDVFGYALHLAQTGGKHIQAKPLQGFGSAGVLEVVEDFRGNTFRAVYTVRFGSKRECSCCMYFRRRLNPASLRRSRTWN
jgi:phage-related protein